MFYLNISCKKKIVDNVNNEIKLDKNVEKDKEIFGKPNILKQISWVLFLNHIHLHSYMDIQFPFLELHTLSLDK